MDGQRSQAVGHVCGSAGARRSIGGTCEANLINGSKRRDLGPVDVAVRSHQQIGGKGQSRAPDAGLAGGWIEQPDVVLHKIGKEILPAITSRKSGAGVESSAD